ncbi:protein kinase domain-containing protein [Thermohalobacter berrensis]|uniref:Protein kinase domain-containing protein n=1 Tax=Thermohalobacter berrensis TaxID=99594 RepID=A0A419T8L1_9FIRM|nr:hypothetical protein [Thermohalobacter berrensis]RKD33884.1 hypothetical protein BET03_08120 [Thermohalobacter berrensis]
MLMLQRGDIIIGKWTNRRYIILKKVGQGGIGVVFKVKDEEGNIRAIKVSDDISSITREYNIMNELQKLDCLPKVYQIDDTIIHNKTFYFFVMDYIRGENLKEIIKYGKLSIKDILSIAYIVVNFFKRVKEAGYSYYDIKLENIVIDKYKKKLLFIDFGGAVEGNLSMKEYTPTYSPEAWGIEVNKGYDDRIIFSGTMLIVNMLLEKEVNPFTCSITNLVNDKLIKLKLNKIVEKFVEKGLYIKYENVNIYLDELKDILIRLNTSNLKIERNYDIIDIVFICSIGLFVLTLIITVNYFI